MRLRRISVVITTTGAASLIVFSPVTRPTVPSPYARTKSWYFWLLSALSGVEDAICLPAISAHRRDRKLGELPAVQLSDFCGRDLELLAQPAQQSTHHLPLRFERSAFGQVDDDSQQSDRQSRRHPSARLGL